MLLPHELSAIETAWGVGLRAGFHLLNDQAWDALQLSGGELWPVSGSPLSAKEIVAARSIAEDWELPAGVVPIIGDFHHLICLDYRNGPEPSIIALDDVRKARELFPTWAAFLAARTLREAAVPPPSTGVIDAESWLDF